MVYAWRNHSLRRGQPPPRRLAGLGAGGTGGAQAV